MKEFWRDFNWAGKIIIVYLSCVLIALIGGLSNRYLLIFGFKAFVVGMPAICFLLFKIEFKYGMKDSPNFTDDHK
jgi:hypothetical protein